MPNRGARATSHLSFGARVQAFAGDACNHRDAVYFDVPLNDGQPAPKLVVEFPRDFRSEEWQFQYLKAAAHMFAFVRQTGQKRAAPPATTPVMIVEDDGPIQDARSSPAED